jgi:GNAT superfamily N-acetyltransferase
VTRDLGNGYELSDDRDRLDRAAVHAYLTTSYWALGRSRERQDDPSAPSHIVGLSRERQDDLIDSSHVVGLYHEGAQVGFARAVDCDAAHFVYLADVYVLEEHRGSGLGVELVREIVENGPYADRTWVLHTRDAAGLYERFGFRHHERLMQRG